MNIGKQFEQELRVGLDEIGWVKKMPDPGALIIEEGQVTGRRFTAQTPVDLFACINGRALAIEAKAISYEPKARWTFQQLREEQRQELVAFHQEGGGYAAIAFNFRYPRTRGIAMLVPISEYLMFEGERTTKSCFVSELIVEFYRLFHMVKMAGGWLIQPRHRLLDRILKYPKLMRQQTILEALPTSTSDERLKGVLHYVPYYPAG